MKKITPDVIKVFIVPFGTLLLSVPLTFLLVGPMANLVSDGLSALFTTIMDFSPLLYGFVLGALWQVLVMFGLHWAIIPLNILQFSQNGWATILVAAMLPSFTQTGVLWAILMKTKEQKVKSVAMPAFISSIFGVTEPAIYGVTLPMKTPFYISCAVSGLIGAGLSFFELKNYAMGALGIFVFPGFVSPEKGMTPMWIMVGFAALAVALSFVIQLFVPVPTLFEKKAVAEKKPSGVREPLRQEIIASPMIGKILPLEQVPDEVFASGAMGKGIAIEPVDSMVVAPTKAEVTLLFPTKHAIGLKTEGGAEILIHVGMDTVSLAGKGFKSFVEVGDMVEAGQVLLEFDIKKIQSAGLPVTTPIIVTNTDHYTDVLVTQELKVNSGDYLLTTVK